MSRIASDPRGVKGKGMRAPSSFIPVYEAVAQHPDLSLTDAAVHGYLARFRMTNADAVIRPSRKRIAETLGITPRTVTRSIAKLEEAGFLCVSVRFGKKGRKSNQYVPYLPGNADNLSDSSVDKLSRAYMPGQDVQGCKRTKRGTVDADASTGATAQDGVLHAGRKAFFAAFSEAHQGIFSRQYVFTPQDAREITRALELGTLDGLDLLDGCQRTLMWLKSKGLSATARAVVNNMARIVAGGDAPGDVIPSAPEFDAAKRRKELGLED